MQNQSKMLLTNHILLNRFQLINHLQYLIKIESIYLIQNRFYSYLYSKYLIHLIQNILFKIDSIQNILFSILFKIDSI